jgi:hypothetical protein
LLVEIRIAIQGVDLLCLRRTIFKSTFMLPKQPLLKSKIHHATNCALMKGLLCLARTLKVP